MSSFDKHGLVNGIWAFRRDGLRQADKGGFDESFKRFVLENPSLYDLQGSTAQTTVDLDWFGTPTTTETTDSKGRRWTRLRYQPTYRGLRILDGEIDVSFVDGILISITGSIVNPASDFGDSGPHVSQESAEKSARTALELDSGLGFEVKSRESGLSLADQKFVHRFRASNTEKGIGTVVSVDALSGKAEGLSEAVSRAPTTANYRIYTPTLTSDTPNGTTQTDSQNTAELDGSTKYPWRLTGVNQLVSFSGEITDQFGTQLSTTTSANFTATPTSAAFKQQQASYYASVAAYLSDSYHQNVASFPSATVNKRLKIVVKNAETSLFTSFDPGAFCHATSPAYDDTWCLRLGVNGTSVYSYPSDLTHRIATVWHEFGHFIDRKYNGSGDRSDHSDVGGNGVCDVGTSEEAHSVAEGIAMAYAPMLFVYWFGTGATFNGYAGFYSNDFALLNGSTGVAHLSDPTVRCYNKPIAQGGPSCTQWHHFAVPFVQAFWESLHGLNCDGPLNEACWQMNDGADRWDANDALFYAMATTSTSATHPVLSGNFLTWYYYHVGETPWGNRWWVFNHHRLVGDAYGYSPCHEY